MYWKRTRDSEERSYCGILWKELLAFLSDFNVGCLLGTALPSAYHSPLLLFTQRQWTHSDDWTSFWGAEGNGMRVCAGNVVWGSDGVPGVASPSSVTLDRSLNFSESQFSTCLLAFSEIAIPCLVWHAVWTQCLHVLSSSGTRPCWRDSIESQRKRSADRFVL